MSVRTRSWALQGIVNKLDLGIIDLSAVCRMNWGLGAQERNNVTSVVLLHISKAAMFAEYLSCAVNYGEHREKAQDLILPFKESTVWQRRQ